MVSRPPQFPIASCRRAPGRQAGRACGREGALPRTTAHIYSSSPGTELDRSLAPSSNQPSSAAVVVASVVCLVDRNWAGRENEQLSIDETAPPPTQTTRTNRIEWDRQQHRPPKSSHAPMDGWIIAEETPDSSSSELDEEQQPTVSRGASLFSLLSAEIKTRAAAGHTPNHLLTHACNRNPAHIANARPWPALERRSP
jgi:hypothetical protein